MDDFVAGLRAFEGDPVSRDRIADYCSELRIEPSSLDRYVTFRPDRYTRNLVYRDGIFDVMVIGWSPGQKTPVHTHNGQLGWMLCERGAIDVTNYRYVSCNTPDNQNVSGIDCLAGATTIQLEPVQSGRVEEGHPVATVDKVKTIHQMACPADAEPCVTVHVYSLPFDSCVSFDLERGRCVRRDLFWDTKNGEPVEATR